MFPKGEDMVNCVWKRFYQYEGEVMCDFEFQ